MTSSGDSASIKTIQTKHRDKTLSGTATGQVDFDH